MVFFWIFSSHRNHRRFMCPSSPAYRAIGNNSETRSGKDFSDNGGPESCHRTFSVSSRGAAAAAGALEINFGLMPRRRHRESFDVTTNSRCPRDVIFRISSAGFLERTIRASLATSQTYPSRIIDPICEVRIDRALLALRIFFLQILRYALRYQSYGQHIGDRPLFIVSLDLTIQI